MQYLNHLEMFGIEPNVRSYFEKGRSSSGEVSDEVIGSLQRDAERGDLVACYLLLEVLKRKTVSSGNGSDLMSPGIKLLESAPVDERVKANTLLGFLKRDLPDTSDDELIEHLKIVERGEHEPSEQKFYFSGSLKSILYEKVRNREDKERYFLGAEADLKKSFELDNNIFAASQLISLYQMSEQSEKAYEILDKCPKNVDPSIDFHHAQRIMSEGIRGQGSQLVELLHNAESQNIVPASYLLGQLYLQGWAVTQNLNTAVKYFEKAASQNDGPALTVLGKLYMEGKVGAKKGFLSSKPNYKHGLKLLGYAAERKEPEAIFILGYLQYLGQHVEQDRESGLQLIEEAASLGYSKAQAFLTKV